MLTAGPTTNHQVFAIRFMDRLVLGHRTWGGSWLIPHENGIQGWLFLGGSLLVSVHYLDVVTFLGKWWDFSSNRFTWWFLVSLLGTYWWFTTGLMGAWVGWRPHEVGGRAGGSDERRRPNGGVGAQGPRDVLVHQTSAQHTCRSSTKATTWANLSFFLGGSGFDHMLARMEVFKQVKRRHDLQHMRFNIVYACSYDEDIAPSKIWGFKQIYVDIISSAFHSKPT